MHFGWQILLSIYVSLGVQPNHSLVGDNYRYSPLGVYNNGYTEQRYNHVLDLITQKYEPIISAQGGTLEILADWTDGAVNAWAWRIGNEFWLEIPGGLSRYHLINEEAFVTTICHELGHLLGGEPMSYDISFEGQADYFSTNQCTDYVMADLKQEKALPKNLEVDDFCLSQNNPDLCDRSIQGSLGITSYYAELESKPAPKISTPDTSSVSQTQQSHPDSQCRLDTMLAGYIDGARPACWFKDK